MYVDLLDISGPAAVPLLAPSIAAATVYFVLPHADILDFCR